MVCIRHTVGDADRRPRDCLSHLQPLIRDRFEGAADSVGSRNLPPPLTFSGPSRTHDTVVFHLWCHFSVTQQNRQTLKSEFDQHYSGTDRTTLPVYSFPDFCTFKADPSTLEIPIFGTNITSTQLRMCWFISCGHKHTGTHYQSLISISIFQICLCQQRQMQKLCRS